MAPSLTRGTCTEGVRSLVDHSAAIRARSLRYTPDLLRSKHMETALLIVALSVLISAQIVIAGIGYLTYRTAAMQGIVPEFTPTSAPFSKPDKDQYTLFRHLAARRFATVRAQRRGCCPHGHTLRDGSPGSRATQGR